MDERKKSSENDQLTGHFQSLFFLSPEQTVKLVKVNRQSVFKSLTFIIFLKICKGQSLLTVSLSKIQNTQTEPQKYFFFSRKQIIFIVSG